MNIKIFFYILAKKIIHYEKSSAYFIKCNDAISYLLAQNRTASHGCYGSTPAPLTIITNPTGGIGPFAYNWQESSDGSTFTDIPGATNITYTPPALTATRWYRLRQNNCSDDVNSNSVQITVLNQVTGGTIGSDQTVCAGAPVATLTNVTNPTGGSGSGSADYSYRWEMSTDGGATWVPASGTPTGTPTGINFTPNPLTQTTLFRRIANDDVSCPGCPGVDAPSNVVTITVNGAISGGTISANQVICTNAAPSPLNNVTAPSGGSGGWTYQWEISTDGGITWANAIGTGATTIGPFTPTPISQTSLFRRRANNAGCGGPVYSNTVLVEVVNLSTTVIGENGNQVFVQSTCNGATFDPNPWQVVGSNFDPTSCSNATQTYQWQSSPDGITWTNMIGQTGASLDLGMGSVTTTTYYRRVTTIGSCTNYSNTVKIVVDNALCINIRWKPNTNGVWNDVNNWQKYDYGRGEWVPACVVPNSDYHVKIDNLAGNIVHIPAGYTAQCADITLGANAKIVFDGNNSYLQAWGNVALNGLLERNTPADRVRLELRGLRCNVVINPSFTTNVGTRYDELRFNLQTNMNYADLLSPTIVSNVGQLIFQQGKVRSNNPLNLLSVQNTSPNAVIATDYLHNYFFYDAPGTPAELSWSCKQQGLYKFPLGVRYNGSFYSTPTELNFWDATDLNTYDSIRVSFFRVNPGTFTTSVGECGNNGYDGLLDAGFWRYLPEGGTGNPGKYHLKVWVQATLWTNFTPIVGTNSWTIAKRADGSSPWQLVGNCDPNCANTISPWLLACRLNVNSFSDAAIPIDNDLPFPVEMLPLVATPNKTEILLTWQTLSEKNNKGFHIYRSEDGTQYQKIGWKDGMINSNIPVSYQFSDKDVKPHIIYYYRLHQEDLDGRFSYSNIAEAMIVDELQYAISIYPNPTDNIVNLNYFSDIQSKMFVKLYDMNGKLLYEQTVNMEIGKGSLQLDLSHLAMATYNLEVSINGKVETFKIVKFK